MLKLRNKELVICIITLLILAFTISSTLATNPVGLLNDTPNNNGNNDYQEIENKTTPKNDNTNKNTNKNNTNTTGMPSTGVDYSVIVVIAVCGISSIYAYKKIRDYNIK